MLRARIASAVALAALFALATVGLSPVAFGAFLLPLVFLAAWEWVGFVPRLRGRGCRAAVAALFLLPCLALLGEAATVPAGQAGVSSAGLWGGRPGLAPLGLALGTAFWLASPILLARHGATALGTGLPWGRLAGGLVAISAAFAALLQLKLWAPNGLWVVVVTFLVAMADIGAYFTGSRYGVRKLAPAISPNKTWEGAWGGLALTALAAAAGVAALRWHCPDAPPRTLLILLALGPLVAVFAMLGDLLESKYKRDAGLKDSGRLLPGHGGLMDRIDGLLAALPPATLLIATVWGDCHGG